MLVPLFVVGTARSRAPRLGALLCVFVAGAALAQIDGAGSLSLDEAVRVAVARSARLASQSAAVQAASATVDRAAELPDPKLRFGLENLPVTDADRFRYDRDFMTMQRISVMQEFPHADKRAAARTRAQSDTRAEQAVLARERAAIRREAALAWLEFAYAHRMLERLDTLERELAFESDAAIPAVTAGRMSIAEVLALRGMQEQVRDRRIAQQRLIDRARIELVRLVGATTVRPPAAPPDSARAPLARDRFDADLDRHPAVIVARAQTALAQAEVQRARASASADWAVELSIARREPAFSNMVSLMFQRDLPLWTERRQDRDVAARVAGLERARALAEEARRSAYAELQLALADHSSAQQRVEHHERALLANARDRTAATTAAYRGGRGNLATVLEARRTETEITLDTLNVERERALAWANLRYALLEQSEQVDLQPEASR